MKTSVILALAFGACAVAAPLEEIKQKRHEFEDYTRYLSAQGLLGAVVKDAEELVPEFFEIRKVLIESGQDPKYFLCDLYGAGGKLVPIPFDIDDFSEEEEEEKNYKGEEEEEEEYYNKRMVLSPKYRELKFVLKRIGRKIREYNSLAENTPFTIENFYCNSENWREDSTDWTF